jgi:hypothetical protein
MVQIPNLKIHVPPALYPLAKTPGVLKMDVSGAYTTTAMFLSGPNPWGLHQDNVFSASLSNIRAGHRIVREAERTQEKERDSLVLLAEDHAMLLKVLFAPSPSTDRPIPPSLAREILPILQAIEEAT